MAQSSNKPPGIRIAGFRSSIPSGYILGRTSAGVGDVELISLGKAQSVGLIPSTLPPSGPAGNDLGGTYPNPTVVGLQGIALPAPTVAHQALLYSGSGYVWTLLHLEAGATGQVLTKVDGTDYNFTWVTPHYLIAGGTTGQVLTKNTNTDYDVTWTTPSAGGSGSSASSFFLDGTHGYIAEVDSNGLLVLDSMGRGVYSVDPVLPVAMLPAAGGYASGTLANLIVNKVKGVTDGSNAAAGDVGELLASITPFASAIIPSNSVSVDVATLTLTPGDWDVSAVIAFFASTVNATSVAFGISTTANTLPSVTADTQGTAEISVALTVNASNIFAIAPMQFNVTVNTTVHLVIDAAFTGSGTPKSWGTLRARRMR